MNYFGSYRHLLKNSQSAMLAAIEIYNKPSFDYRDECFTILLINAWELMLKALLSKNRNSIYYPKRRGEPYKTLAWKDAFGRATKFFPADINPLPVRRNLELLSTYRDNSVHFYNADGFGTIIYSLAQTSIVNFRDVMTKAFDIDIDEEITWNLMPLGLNCPIDPIAYLAGPTNQSAPACAPVGQFLSELASALSDVETHGQDTGRVMTIFRVKLESVKKVQQADVVAGIDQSMNANTQGPLVIERKFDPNDPNWVRRKNILEELPELHGKKFTSHTFDAVVWHQKIKDKPHLCWVSKEGALTKYSREIVAVIRRLGQDQVNAALAAYKSRNRRRRA